MHIKTVTFLYASDDILRDFISEGRLSKKYLCKISILIVVQPYSRNIFQHTGVGKTGKSGAFPLLRDWLSFTGEKSNSDRVEGFYSIDR